MTGTQPSKTKPPTEWKCPYCKHDKDIAPNKGTPENFKEMLMAMRDSVPEFNADVAVTGITDKTIADNVKQYTYHQKNPDIVHNSKTGKWRGHGQKDIHDYGNTQQEKKSAKSCPFCKDFAALTADHPMKIDNLVNLQDMHDRNPEAFHKKLDGYIRNIEKARMAVSSPEEGKTCNCETGDHSNAGGQEHGMFNQDIGRQNWQGQGLPQPKQDKDSCQCDEKPVEANKVPNADARLGDDEMKEEKKKTDVCPNCGKKRKGKKTQQILNFLTQPPDIYPSEIDDIGDDEDEKKKAYCQCNKVYDKHGKELKIVNPLQAARPTGGKTGKDFLPDAAKIDEKVETYYGHIPESKVGGKHNAPPHKQSKGDKWMSRHYTPEALQEHERTTYDPDLAEKLTANKADDDEQITGTSTGAKKTPNPKKYLHKPSEHNPMGVINPQWTDWRAARRKQLKEGKRETDSKKLLENMSTDTKLNLQTQAKLISAGTQSINDQKRSEQNKKRKPMSKKDLAARRKRLLGKAILKIKAMLERLKISDDDVVRETSGGDWNINPNREIVGAKDEADRKRRAQGLGGKGGCRGVGCDNKATKKLIGHVRDHLSGSTQDKPLSSTREHKEIINVCPDCYKKWKKYQKDQKRRGNTAKTERGDGTWGMRGLGEGQGTTDIQGSGETYLISPVKQEELNRLMQVLGIYLGQYQERRSHNTLYTNLYKHTNI